MKKTKWKSSKLYIIFKLNVWIVFIIQFVLEIAGESDRNKIPPEIAAATQTNVHWNQVICIVQRKATGM